MINLSRRIIRHTLPNLHRCYVTEVQQMKLDYERARLRLHNAEDTTEKMSPHTIFCNNEVNLDQINCYGFDYDYTLAQYTNQLDLYIFEEAKRLLVNNLKYHKDVMNLEFDTDFAVRGLHYDARNGMLLKIDEYNNVQKDAVYRGKNKVTHLELLETYGDENIPQSRIIKPKLEDWDSMSQLLDLFVIPEMNLISAITQLFMDRGIEFDPAYLHQDISKSIRSIHKSGQLHNEILDNLNVYIEPNPELNNLLQCLNDNNKSLFMITNSDFNFVNKGMIYLTNNEKWQDFFDVVITSAKKPEFFTSTNQPFRRLINGELTWTPVHNFEKSGAYKEGNLHDFMKYTNWSPREIFYFGDHIYADLEEVASTQGWKTGCIIRELESEVNVLNSDEYRRTLRGCMLLEHLVDRHQHVKSAEGRALLRRWILLKSRLRKRCKNHFNKRFGSIFRTYKNPTHFSQRISLYADLYTSSVNNLMLYPLSHQFYPRRQTLPHEPPIYEVLYSPFKVNKPK